MTRSEIYPLLEALRVHAAAEALGYPGASENVTKVLQRIDWLLPDDDGGA